MSKIIVLASFYPKKDKIMEAKEIILSMIKPTRSENKLKDKIGRFQC